MRRPSVADIRAAWWTLRTERRTASRLRAGGLDEVLGPPGPPPLPRDSIRAVKAVLRRTQASCVVRSVVLQSWFAAQGDHRDLIVGVRGPGESFGAHAWLEGEQAHGEGPYHELLRRAAG